MLFYTIFIIVGFQKIFFIMKIESLYIERFGALRDKRLEDFRPDVEVIYAPNESGKTTFIQFVRCMLYGLYAGRAYAGEEQRMSGRLTFTAGNPSKRRRDCAAAWAPWQDSY